MGRKWRRFKESFYFIIIIINIIVIDAYIATVNIIIIITIIITINVMSTTQEYY